MQAHQPPKSTPQRRRRRTKEEMEMAREAARLQGLSPTQIRLGAPKGSEAERARRMHNNTSQRNHRVKVASNMPANNGNAATNRHGIVAALPVPPTMAADGFNYREAGGGRVMCDGKLPFLVDLNKGMLDRNAIEWELKTKWDNHLKAAMQMSEADTAVHDAAIDKLPYRNIAGSYMKPVESLDGLSVAKFSHATFGKAMTTRVRFGSSNYNLMEVALLTNVHHVILLALVNLHGMDWAHRLNVKLLERKRGMFTLFRTDGNWHTPVTFAYVYGGTAEEVLTALEEGRAPVAHRSMDAAITLLATKVRVSRDGFGAPAMCTHMPLFTYLHMPEVVKLYPTAVKDPTRRQLPNVLDLEDDE